MYNKSRLDSVCGQRVAFCAMAALPYFQTNSGDSMTGENCPKKGSGDRLAVSLFSLFWRRSIFFFAAIEQPQQDSLVGHTRGLEPEILLRGAHCRAGITIGML
jgi:hypothetical protein